MDICIVTKDALLARFLTLELAELGLSAEVREDCAQDAQVYLCDLDGYTGDLPENTVGFSYDESKRRRVQAFLPRPILAEALHEAVKGCMTKENKVAEPHILTADRTTRRVKGGNGEVRLSEKEFALLEKLCAVELLSREAATAVFGEGDSNVVDVYMHYLRKKLKSVCPYDVIASKRGEGYALTGTVVITLS